MSANAHVSRARALLQEVRGTRPDDDAVIALSVELAALLLEASLAMQTHEERERAELLGALMSDPDGQAFTTLLTDRAYRSHDPARIVDAARQLLRRLGIPDYLPRFARLQMQALLRMGPFVPRKAADGLLHRLRTESSPVVLPAEEPQLSEHLARRAAEGVRVNLNHLGEAVLGEAEARARMDHYLQLLARPDVESISVKVSSIHGQIDLLAWDQTLEVLVERLSELYRAALAHPYRRPDGTQLPKLVNLDMEAYADLELTLAAFRAAMDRDELLPLTAGVVLQAYLPDAAPRQRELTQWAQDRRARGGAPIRLRLVKGANLLTEQALASVRGFQAPVLPDKTQVDASYKKVLEYACEPEHAEAVQVGVASHNLFDLACGMVLRASRQVEHRVSFELLEGMADHVRRAVTAVADDTLVYAPVVEERAMQTAIAYLMRRLDENISEENFLRHSLELRVGQPEWDAQRERFERAFRGRRDVSEDPRRDQDRRRAPGPPHTGPFENEPDTDFTQAHNREWIWRAIDGARDADHGVVRCCIGGSDLDGDALTDGFDPSRPGHVPYRMALADAPAVERALEASRRAAASWSAVPVAERVAILRAVAARLRAARGELIALMALDGGKRIDQSDPEVSEAIDFAEFYAVNHAELDASPHLRLAPKGVVLVTPPWNFPLAIPLGGTLASLVAGNAVILKPALETPLVARRLAELCWEAGVPREALQFVVCEDRVGSLLVRDPRVDAVVLTGASDTARLFHQMRPGIDLAAETGGKNAIIVSALADRDAAIQDAVYSAFGHAGQKCSACSLLICEAEVYDDPGFLSTLRDAAESLPVGPAWDPRSVVTPLIMPARDPLLGALTTLEEGERWLLEPRRDADNVRLWSPGIKLDVREGSVTHQTEFFGPLLAVMRADDLDHALRLANGTPYGLTAGL
ncbi:MAG: bifunctional proline dehydrogenase/L-glutamate gamma-semialdehyde dehydrogenase, partial [Myxococcales bacterium]